VLLPFALLTGVFCQSFEVASVKPSTSTGGRVTMNRDPERISYTNIMLRRVLLAAYDVKNYQLLGPEWLDTARFDITARIPEGATEEQFQAMLRDLLVTRFKMTIHRESKELPIYALLIAKNGAKLNKITPKPQEAAPAGDEQLAAMQKDEGKDGFPVLTLPTAALVIETRNGKARITAREAPLAKLADLLSGQLGRPVFDLTGLAGNFSFVLYFTPESGDSSEPFLFAALQRQLGLKLEARKGPVELLVVDHAERIPTAN
jgi:uncharacterized protein (TIGR03435 family)